MIKINNIVEYKRAGDTCGSAVDDTDLDGEFEKDE